jgi:GDP-4-dehydro-6-deoxy-D-mannose reductase
MKKPHAFITGIAGFTGIHLAEDLLNNGYNVSGSIYKYDSSRNINLLKKKVDLHKLDILDEKRILTIIKKINPDYIFHLAAISSVGQSYKIEKLTYQINVVGTFNLLQVANKLNRLKKIIFASSSEVYGMFKPINKILVEEDIPNPLSPYAVTKTAAEQICQMYQRQFNIPVVISRSFNQSGPFQDERFVIPSFCSQIAQIESGERKPIMKVGNLSAKRDISDVRDIVVGYRRMAEKGKVGRVYHLCSGKSIKIQTILNKLIKLSNKKITVKTDSSLFRKDDIPIMKGNKTRATKELGYRCRYNIDKTLKDTLDFWREKYNK